MVAFRLLPSVNRMNANLNAIMFNKTSIDVIYDDLKETKDFNSNRRIENKDYPDSTIKNLIKIQNIDYKYPNTEKYVLKNVNFEVPIGKSVAITGVSGSGKTTLVDLILGLLKPTNGYIFADLVNVHENLEYWLKKVAYMPQVIYLSDDSIRNNVGFGLKPDEINDNEIWKALEQAQLKEFVENLPERLDTVVGERGVKISGGQKQRVGIARALYNNPEVLILDEATSALDNETEEAVMESIDNLRNKLTIIIIAHRLSTISKCDIIFEVMDGRVINKQNLQ